MTIDKERILSLEDFSDGILRVLYEAWFPEAGYLDIVEASAREGWDRRLCDATIERLKNRGFVEGVGFGHHCRLTPQGVFTAESRGVAEPTLIESKQRLRRRVLEHLRKASDDSPHNSDVHFATMATWCELDGETVLGIYTLLQAQGLVEPHTVGSVLITFAGRDWLERVGALDAESGHMN